MAEKLNFPLGKWHSFAYTILFFYSFCTKNNVWKIKKDEELKHGNESDGGNITFLIQLFNFNN